MSDTTQTPSVGETHVRPEETGVVPTPVAAPESLHEVPTIEDNEPSVSPAAETPSENGHTAPDPVEEVDPRFEVKGFNATNLKHFALFLRDVIDDKEVQGAVNFIFRNLNDTGALMANAGSLMGSLLGAGLQEDAQRLETFLASLLDMSPEEFGKQDAIVYTETIKSLTSHPKFADFLKSARGMVRVIGSRWRTSS